MLLLGRTRQRTCQGLTRRAFVQIGASAVLGLSMADLRHLGATANRGRARAVIFLWLWGGPSQLDTFDPKPNAPSEYRGPFASIPTRLTGVRVGELFPQVAGLTDRIAILRSLHTQSNDHGVAGTAGLTGSIAGAANLGGQTLAGSARPALGSCVARARAAGAVVPPFMVVGGRLHQGKKAIIGEGAGPLGARYDPFRIECDDEQHTRLPAPTAPGQPNARTAPRSPDAAALARSGTAKLRYAGPGHRRLSCPGARAVDRRRTRRGCSIYPRNGPHSPIAMAGRASGNRACWRDGSCSMACRSCRSTGAITSRRRKTPATAAGTITIATSSSCRTGRRRGSIRRFAALIGDLRERGMLDSTLVVAVGEFGRTPRINEKAGRDHWEHCYSALAAGGGVHGGRVIGESDARAERPHDRPRDARGPRHQRDARDRHHHRDGGDVGHPDAWPGD